MTVTQILTSEYSKLLFAEDGVEPEWHNNKLLVSEVFSQAIQQHECQKNMGKTAPNNKQQMLPVPYNPADPQQQQFNNQQTPPLIQIEREETEIPSGKYQSKKGQMLENFLTKSGVAFKTGLTATGTFVGKGIKKSSGIFKMLVGKPGKPVKIEKRNIDKINKASDTVKGVSEFTIGQVERVIDYAINLGKTAASETVGAKNTKNIEGNKYIIRGTHVGKGVINFACGIYDGLEGVRKN